MSPERCQRISEVLARRQLDLSVCLENVHKPHNISAVVRTCDAVGIHRMHIVWEGKYKVRGRGAMGSQQWVRMDTHETIGEAIQTVKDQGMQVLVTHLSDKAVDFREIDYTRPTCILLGQERYGVTDTALAMADQEIVVPMMGMVQSLNVSVAAALVLYEAQRQRQIAGWYDRPQLSHTESQQLLFERGYPRLRRMCDTKGLPYPPIDTHGQIQADESWWQQMQLSKQALTALEADEADNSEFDPGE